MKMALGWKGTRGTPKRRSSDSVPPQQRSMRQMRPTYSSPSRAHHRVPSLKSAPQRSVIGHSSKEAQDGDVIAQNREGATVGDEGVKALEHGIKRISLSFFLSKRVEFGEKRHS